MTKEELQILYSKVVEYIRNYDSYHVWYTCGEETWSADGQSVTFEVFGYSDQDEGADWTEYWGIDSNGIHSEDKIWKTFDEFKRDFI